MLTICVCWLDAQHVTDCNKGAEKVVALLLSVVPGGWCLAALPCMHAFVYGPGLRQVQMVYNELLHPVERSSALNTNSVIPLLCTSCSVGLANMSVCQESYTEYRVTKRETGLSAHRCFR
jgi:hypothetical protein